MSNFRTKLLAVTAFATAFAGMSYGQLTGCAQATTGNPTLRAEGQTEVVADVQITGCTNAAATSGTVYATLSQPVTSRSVIGSTAGNSDAVLQVIEVVTGQTVSAGTPVTQYAVASYIGTVSGNTATFSVPTGGFPATGVAYAGPANTGATVTAAGTVSALILQISNIRINATGNTSPQVTESVLISNTTGAGVTGNVSFTPSSVNVGYILQSLGNTSLLPTLQIFTATPYTTCAGNNINTSSVLTTTLNTSIAITAGSTNYLSFIGVVKQLVSGAFRTQTQENGSYPGAGTGITGYAAAAAALPSASTIGQATSGTIINYTITNVPASATVYVPQSITVGTTTLTIANSTPQSYLALPSLGTLNGQTTSETGSGGVVGFTPSSGAVTIPYTVAGTNPTESGPNTFYIPTWVGFAGNTATAQSPMSVLIAYGNTTAVSGPAGTVPSFTTAVANTAVSGSALTSCQTNLMFPFVTNTLGFDTGIVIANTTTDNLSTVVPGGSSVKAQSGSCTLYFYGATPANVPVPGGSIASGTVATPFLLSTVQPGYQGYMIATCPFQDAKGYAFVESGLGTSSGVAQGYIAEVMTRGNGAADSGGATSF